MRRQILPSLLLLLAALLVSCTDQAGVSGPGTRSGTLALAPHYSYIGGQYSFAPINRIRLTARRTSDDSLVADTVIDVVDSPEWSLAFNVPADAGNVIVEIQLVNVTNGTESVEWSGKTDPITVKPGESNAPARTVELLPGPPANLSITALTITPDGETVVEGTQVILTANVTGGGQGVKIYWNSLDPNIASVDANGLVNTLRNGSARIIAFAGAKADTVLIIATQRVASVTLTPDTQRIVSIGGDALYSARVLDPRNVEIANSPVTFSIDNPIADQVSPGRFRAKTNGTATVTATSIAAPTITRSATLIVAQRAGRVDVSPTSASVTAIGRTQQFSAVVKDANGNEMSTPVTWRSSNTAVATVDANGLATARGVGTADIAAVINAGAPDSVIARATFLVAQTLSSIEISPTSMQLASIGDTVRFSAVARDANNNVMPGVSFAWSTSNMLVGSVNTLGTFTAADNGSVVVTAAAGGLRANANVVVAQVAANVAVLKAVDTVEVGATRQFSATALDARGNAITNAQLTWRSSDTTKATVSSSGLATGRATGSVTIGAGAVNGVVGSATLVIRQTTSSNVVVASIKTSPVDTVYENDSSTVRVVLRNIGTTPSDTTRLRFKILDAASVIVTGALADTTLAIPSILPNDSLVITRVLRATGIGTWPDMLKLYAQVNTSELYSTNTYVKFAPRVWAGGNTNWLDSNNWLPRGIPRASIDITIPDSLVYYPVLTSNAVVHNLVMTGNGRIDVGTFNLGASGTMVKGSIIGSGTVFISAPNAHLRGAFPNLTIQNSAVVDTFAMISGSLTVTAGALDVGGAEVEVSGDFSTLSSGALKMTEYGELSVFGNITFNGGDETGLLTAGEIDMYSMNPQTFTTGSNANMFMTTGTNLELMFGDKTVIVGHPAHRFAGVELSTDGKLSLPNGMTVRDFYEGADLPSTVTGNGTLKVDGGLLALAGVTFKGLTLELDSVAVEIVDGVSFGGYSTLPSVDQLIVRTSASTDNVLRHVTLDSSQVPDPGHYWVSLHGNGYLRMMYPSPATKPDSSKVYDPTSHIEWPYTPW